MLFPQDSKLERVTEEPTGRTFKLSFASSQAIHFVRRRRCAVFSTHYTPQFYLQSQRSEAYKARLPETVNSIIDDPENASNVPKLPTEAYIREHPEEFNDGAQSMETD